MLKSLLTAAVAFSFPSLGKCRRKVVLQRGDCAQMSGRSARIQTSEGSQIWDRGNSIRAVRLKR